MNARAKIQDANVTLSVKTCVIELYLARINTLINTLQAIIRTQYRHVDIISYKK